MKVTNEIRRLTIIAEDIKPGNQGTSAQEGSISTSSISTVPECCHYSTFDNV